MISYPVDKNIGTEFSASGLEYGWNMPFEFDPIQDIPIDMLSPLFPLLFQEKIKSKFSEERLSEIEQKFFFGDKTKNKDFGIIT